jgi:hypothetical protein
MLRRFLFLYSDDVSVPLFHHILLKFNFVALDYSNFSFGFHYCFYYLVRLKCKLG